MINDSLDDAKHDKLCGEALENPEFVGVHTQELKLMLKEALEKGKETDQIVALLSRLKEEDPAFDYRISWDARRKAKVFVWQDGVMRKHCQDGLCDVFMLDMMKRQQNSADWPYCGPVLITGENKAVCGCEAIVISEDSESYIFVMNSLYDMSGVSRDETKIIFGDGIMSTNLLTALGIDKTCNLILDRYHLKKVDWKKKFRWDWNRMEPLMEAVMYAKSEAEYDIAIDNVRKKIRSQEQQDYIEKEVHPNRFHFVDYWIKVRQGSHFHSNSRSPLISTCIDSAIPLPSQPQR